MDVAMVVALFELPTSHATHIRLIFPYWGAVMTQHETPAVSGLPLATDLRAKALDFGLTSAALTRNCPEVWLRVCLRWYGDQLSK